MQVPCITLNVVAHHASPIVPIRSLSLLLDNYSSFTFFKSLKMNKSSCIYNDGMEYNFHYAKTSHTLSLVIYAVIYVTCDYIITCNCFGFIIHAISHFF
jgi:hypothetical protein